MIIIYRRLDIRSGVYKYLDILNSIWLSRNYFFIHLQYPYS